MNDIKKLIKEEIKKKEEKILLAVSGGPDSIFLLCMLKQLEYKNIYVVHINHQTRAECDLEEEFVKKITENYGYKFYSEKYIHKDSGNFHNSAREFRYSIFKKIYEKENCNVLITGHHGDDLIETVLMRIIRGSNLSGYSAFQMKEILFGMNTFRPLLITSKESIINYLDEFNIEYKTDSSNKKTKYTRNRIRLNVIPEMKKENPNLIESFLNYSNELYNINKFIEKEVTKIYNSIKKGDSYNIDLLKDKDEIIVKKVYEKILKNEYNEDLNYLQKTNINEIIKVTKQQSGLKKIDLPLNRIIMIEYDSMSIKRRVPEESFNTESRIINLGEELKLDDKSKLLFHKNCAQKNNNFLYLNSNKIKLPLYIKNNNENIDISIKNLNGTKKFNRIMIDSKIPNYKRKEIYVLFDSNNEPLWIPGIKKTVHDRFLDKDYDIIIEYVEGGKNE